MKIEIPTIRQATNPLFQERIEKYKIPPWPYQAKFDRIVVFQIDTVESETFKDSMLVKSEETKQRERNRSPRGVLVSAGFRALDHLVSNDILIGDIVWIAPNANYAFSHEVGGGRHVSFCFLRTSEIVGSEDSSGRIARGEVTIGASGDGRWGVEGRARVDIDAPEDAM